MLTKVQRKIATGWGQVAVLSCTEVTSWGILYYAFPVFLVPMTRELHWQQTTLTGAYSLALLLSGLFAIPVGRWLDHLRSPRLIMTLGSLVAVCAVAAWAVVSTPLLFYLVWVALGFSLATTLYEPAFVTTAMWFPQRERALTVLTTIGGLASVIYLPIAAVLVQHIGWRPTLLIFSGVLAIGTLVPHAIALRPFPAIATTSVPRTSVRVAHWRLWAFWQLIIAFVLAQLAIAAVLVHLVPFLVTQGESPTFAATATGMIGSVSLLGRIIITWNSTARTRAMMIGVVFLLQTCGIVILVMWQGFFAVVAFVVLFGVGFGIISPARAGLVADRFGTATFGHTNGQMALAVTLARAATPVGASFLLLLWGNYHPVFWLLGALSFFAAILLLLPQQFHKKTSPRTMREEVSSAH